jgi:hypothetical protein
VTQWPKPRPPAQRRVHTKRGIFKRIGAQTPPPNYDPARLAKSVCATKGWTLKQARFYTGVPSADDNKAWNSFWTRKLLTMSRAGVHVYSRPLRYRNKVVLNGASVLVGEEKGIDVRIAIDILSWQSGPQPDCAPGFSRDGQRLIRHFRKSINHPWPRQSPNTLGFTAEQQRER